MERPTAKLALYIAAKTMNAIKIRFPKIVSNKLTNKLGTANITIHNASSNVINPTTKLRLFLEKTLEMLRLMFILYNAKKIEFKNSLK